MLDGVGIEVAAERRQPAYHCHSVELSSSRPDPRGRRRRHHLFGRRPERRRRKSSGISAVHHRSGYGWLTLDNGLVSAYEFRNDYRG